jgi:hypothetical protein
MAAPILSPPHFSYPNLMELVFEVRDAEEGAFFAQALGHSIFTDADTWDELRANILEAVSLDFEDSPEQLSAFLG